MAKIERQKPVELEHKKRVSTFDEVSKGLIKECAEIEAGRCLNCKNAPCKKGCPVGVNIPEFITCVKNGDMEGAIRQIKATNNLPSICGRVCPQESQCESKCIRAKMEGPVAIGQLERYVADYFLNKQLKFDCKKDNGKKVAVIGSGPAGLTCAADLRLSGCDVTIFEAFHKAGGVLVYGIPEFRLPKKLVETEIENLKKLGVKIELNTIIGKTIMMDELLSEFDGVFIGTGAGLPVFMNIPGENLVGVISANEYLTRVNLMGAYDSNSSTPIRRAKDVVVVGAGNVAMDSARTALRMGADSVRLVYRRTRSEMPAREEELVHAEEEGIVFELLSSPVEILGENGRVKQIKCIKMQLGEPDASGRRSPVAIKGSDYMIDTDMVIMSIGTSPNPMLRDSCEQLKTTSKGTIIVDEDTMQTSIDNVYAGGDAVTGAATVILAMGAGKIAASNLLKKMKVE